MAQKTNSFERFWKELKRRKVFGVVTTYAATAYIIIEVTNNLVEPLSLPAWIAKLVILLLGAGLPFVVILSWIFDFTPQGIKKTESLEESEKVETPVKPVKRKLRASYVLNAILIIAVIILAYPKIIKRDTLERLRSSGEKVSVAVMPFQNMTNDTTKNFWQEMIQDNLITSLSNSEELRVRQTESINHLIQSKSLSNYTSVTPTIASDISQKLDANIFIYGSIKKEDTIIRVNAQLIDSKTLDVFKSFQIDGTTNKVMPAVDSLTAQIKNFLIISKLGKELSPDWQHLTSTNSPEAYKNFIHGQKAFSKFDYSTAIKFYLQALAIDSNFIFPTIAIFWAYNNQGMGEEARKWCIKAYEKRDQMTLMQKSIANTNYASYFETVYEVINSLKQTLEYDDQLPDVHSDLGVNYAVLSQYNQAIPEYKRALEIYNKWGVKPFWSIPYSALGTAYHRTSQYKKEKKIYKKAEQDFPDDPFIIHHKARLAAAEGDTASENEYIKKYISIRKELSWSEARIATNLAMMYHEEGILDKAEKYYRQALLSEPENPVRMADLAYFLIDKDRNINEGMKLIEKVLKLKPDYYSFLHTKGWGLYKEGNYQDALKYLQKSDSLKPLYVHNMYLHLVAAKKAVANQKRTDR